MNDLLTPASVDKQALPGISSDLEDSRFHQQPARDLNFFLDVRESLLRRHVADVERECFIRALIVVARACFAAATPQHGLIAMKRAEAVAIKLPDSDLRPIHGDPPEAFAHHACPGVRAGPGRVYTREIQVVAAGGLNTDGSSGIITEFGTAAKCS